MNPVEIRVEFGFNRMLVVRFQSLTRLCRALQSPAKGIGELTIAVEFLLLEMWLKPEFIGLLTTT
jgi:hypothetical protein